MSPSAISSESNATIKDAIIQGGTASDKAGKPSPRASDAKGGKQANTATPLKVTCLCHFILRILCYNSSALFVACGSIVHL